jgi:glycosyltransferase involved in cell wall biosynthesis
MAADTHLTILLPCYNPLPGWIENVIAKFNNIKTQIPGTKLVIINDGSENLTPPKNFIPFNSMSDVLLLSYPANRGKGYALREGIKAAESDFIIYTDIDFPYTYDSFLKLYSTLLKENSDVAIGIRGEEYYRHLPKARVRISKLLKWFIKTFLRIPIADTQCGLKGMNQKGKQIFLRTTIDRYLFDLEFVFLAARNKLKIQPVEVELRPEIQLSKMNWKILLQEFGNFLKIFVRTI